jgi:hypothetical protein
MFRSAASERAPQKKQVMTSLRAYSPCMSTPFHNASWIISPIAKYWFRTWRDQNPLTTSNETRNAVEIACSFISLGYNVALHGVVKHFMCFPLARNICHGKVIAWRLMSRSKRCTISKMGVMLCHVIVVSFVALRLSKSDILLRELRAIIWNESNAISIRTLYSVEYPK